MRTSSNALILAVALGVVAPPRPAFAQEPSASDFAQARELYNDGKQLRARGDNLGAAEKIKAAHAIAATPLTGYELGRTYLLLGRLVDAQEAFLSVARMPVRKEETERSAEARRESARLAEEVRARIPSLMIRVTGVPADTVAVSIDGATIPTPALAAPRLVDPGWHQISARSTTGGTADARVELKESDYRTVELALAFKGASPIAPSTQAVPGGEPVPAHSPGPQAGGMSTLRILGLASGGVGLVGLGLGGIFAGLAQSASNSQQQECPSPTNCPNHAQAVSDHSTSNTDSSVAIASFVAAGAFLAAGVTMFLVGGNKAEGEPRTAAILVPIPLAGGAGLTLRGGF